MEVRVRVAPSPTGTPHIGFSRTAVFNWLFAKANKGKFILRIEDTDQVRLVPGSEEKIIEGLKWLEIEPDESPIVGGEYGPYTQSQRLDLYHKYADQLLKSGKAYKDDGAIRFKTKTSGVTSWDDLVHGKIEFTNDTFGDFVIIKSDGYPTYHFAHVIDDHLMQITHVFRGDEWISSTPKHIQMFEALGWGDEMPFYVHLPLIVGPDRAKLSKRHGAESAMIYRDNGYLPEAIFNFLALLGWSPKTDQEIFTREELIAKFDLKGINPTMPIFNLDKLNWYNGQYIRALSDSDLADRIISGNFINTDFATKDQILKIIPLIKERMVTLKDFEKFSTFFFEKFTPNISELLKKHEEKEITMILKDILSLLNQQKDFNALTLEETLRGYVEKTQQKTSSVFMILRVAVTGSTATPPLFQTMEVIGKDECLIRIEQNLSQIK